MVKVSVLVAVYNASAYLHECLDSLTGQSLRDIQIICIDDCSTDNSLSILNDYASRDGRINVLALPDNHGQAYARNQGLKIADGEYICMLDADDWYSSDALARAVDVFEEFENTDCVLFDTLIVHPDHSELYEMPDFEVLTGREAFELSLTWKIHGIYMVRSILHKRWPYDDTCRLYSDDNTTRMHYLEARTVRRCSGIYHYRQHQSSSTHRVSVRRFDYLRANESMRNVMIKVGVDDELVAIYENHRWYNLIDVYMFYHCHGKELSSSERRYGLSEIKRVWQTIDKAVLKRDFKLMPGYYPVSVWWLFRFQEWLFFTVRGWFGRNR